MSEKRDAATDLKVCESIEKVFERDPNLCGWMDMAMPNQLISFVRCSREALPYWIRRAQQAEDENIRLKKQYDKVIMERYEETKEAARFQVEKQDAEAERDQAVAEVEAIREAAKKWMECPTWGGPELDTLLSELNHAPAAKAYAERVKRIEAALIFIAYQPCSNKKNKEMYGSCRQSPDCLTEYCLPCIAKAALDSVRY